MRPAAGCGGGGGSWEIRCCPSATVRTESCLNFFFLLLVCRSGFQPGRWALQSGWWAFHRLRCGKILARIFFRQSALLPGSWATRRYPTAMVRKAVSSDLPAVSQSVCHPASQVGTITLSTADVQATLTVCFSTSVPGSRTTRCCPLAIVYNHHALFHHNVCVCVCVAGGAASNRPPGKWRLLALLTRHSWRDRSQ